MRGECNPLSPDAVRGACNPQLNANLQGVQGFVRLACQLVTAACSTYIMLNRAKIAKLPEKPNNRLGVKAAGLHMRKCSKTRIKWTRSVMRRLPTGRNQCDRPHATPG